MADITTKRDTLPNRTLLQGLLDDHLLLSAVVLCVLLIGYQLAVPLLQPPRIQPVTEWLRTVLAWPQVLVVAWVAVQLRRTQKPGAAAVSWAALALLSYAVGCTLWTIAHVAVNPQGVPIPSLPDLLFLLQYPC